MPGAGQEQQLISVPQGPLVSPAADVLNTGAVDNLVDAFRKGFVTSQDIVDRIGDIGKAKKQALLQSLGEHVSPEAINSRMAAYKSAGAQSDLATAQANAEMPLVAPKADLAATTFASQKAALVGGAGGLQAFQQYAPWFGESPEDYKNSNGTYDFQKMTSRGNQIGAQMSIASNWINQLTPASEKTVEDAAGNKYVQQWNKFGVNVTPPHPETGYPGSPAYWAYVKQLDKVLPDYHPMRGQFLMTPTGGDEALLGHPPGSVSPHTAAPLVSPAVPETPEIGRMRATLVQQGGADPAEAVTLTPEEVRNRFLQMNGQNPTAPVVTPTTPTVTPIAPGAPPAAAVVQPQVSPSLGVPMVAAKGAYQTPSEIKTQLFADPVYKTFAEQQKYAENFKTVANAIESTPPPSKKVEINNDIGLAESIIKLYDPQAALREFKWTKLDEAQPWLEKIGAWKQLALREGSFTPEARQRLIKMGDDIVGGMEQSIKGRLAQSVEIAKQSAAAAGQNPDNWVDQTLTANEKRILAGQPFRPTTRSAPAAVPPGGKLVDIPGRGRGYILPGGRFLPAQ